ncbi:MAG TPA: N-acetylglucosamine-6-phosphate deacetylase, partial [Candidatus Eisenbacteria bacterium]|nr:N-acetylglucosamine-6-phosphate deacetylase [Candidatus Eisenbacteria bacterium]
MKNPMNGGEISARHYATRELIYLRWQDGRITSLETATQSAATNLWVAPALMDVQVNGFGGFDFQQDDLQLADLLSAARQLQGAGCATFLLTLITDEWEKLMNR